MSKNISSLTAAGDLTGTEIVPIVQGGNTRRTTIQNIADVAAGPFHDVTLTAPSTFGAVYDQNISIPSGCTEVEIYIYIPTATRTGGINPTARINNDGGANYNFRRSYNYATSTESSGFEQDTTAIVFWLASTEMSTDPILYKMELYRPVSDGPIFFEVLTNHSAWGQGLTTGFWNGSSAWTSVDIAAEFGEAFPTGTRIVARSLRED